MFKKDPGKHGCFEDLFYVGLYQQLKRFACKGDGDLVQEGRMVWLTARGCERCRGSGLDVRSI